MTEPAKITGFSIQDFKRIRLVEIRPEENGLTILGGRNAQGKSSCLDAIAYALGGESFRPSDINNHEGEKNAAIRVEIDGLIVERAGKNAALKITDARGMRGNQTLLNDIVGKFALDLGAFMRASDTEKAKLLLKMFPELEQQLAEMKTQSDRIREERADQNRDIKRLQVHFDEMPQYADVPAEEISLESLTAELQRTEAGEREAAERRALVEKEQQAAARYEQELADNRNLTAVKQGELDGMEARHGEELKDLETEFARRKEDLQKRFEQRKADLNVQINGLLEKENGIKQAIADQQQALADMEANLTGDPDFAAIKAGIMEKMNQAGETNRKIRANQERRKLYDQICTLKEKAMSQTEDLTRIELDRTALLQNAKLPLVDLSINADGELLYKGQKWDCMSGAERLKVATSICMKSKPGCGFVLIDGLEAMDPQTLKEFSEYLTACNMQGIGTIVGDTAATVIIEDGKVQNQEAPAETPENITTNTEENK